MNRRIFRRLAFALVAFLAFAQASVALAQCAMDRGEMAQMTDDGCCGSVDSKEPAPQVGNACVTHCTADLQLSGLPVALVQGPVLSPVLLLPRVTITYPPESPPARSIPPRILLHSYLI